MKKKNALEEDKKTFIGFFVSILIISVIEFILELCCTQTKNLSLVIDISQFIKLFLLILVIILYTFKFKKIQIDQNFYILIVTLAIISVSCLTFYLTKVMNFFEKFDNTNTKRLVLQFVFAYPLFFMYLGYVLYTKRKYYFNVKYKVRFVYVLAALLFYGFIRLTIYDEDNKLYFSHHNDKQIDITRQSLIGVNIIFFIFKIFEQDDNQKEVEIAYKPFNLKIYLIFFAFYISDEVERIFFIINFLVFYEILITGFKATKNFYSRVIYLTLLQFLPHLHFIAMQGNYTMNVSIKVRSRAVARSEDDDVIYIGMLFFLNKMKAFWVGGILLYDLVKKSKENMINLYSKLLRLLMDFSGIFGILMYFLYIKIGKEEYYLHFLFYLGVKFMPSMVFDFAFLMNKGCYKLFEKFKNWISHKFSSSNNFNSELLQMSDLKFINEIEQGEL